MRLVDYLRLGFAGVKAHKKRAFTVVIIVGLMFSVISAGVFVLQGLEDRVLGTMLAPTGGKVLVMSSVDTQVCGEDCDTEAEVGEMKRNIETYGGRIIKVEVSQTTDGMFYKLGEGVFKTDSSNADRGATEVVVPLGVVATLADIEMPERDADLAEKLEAIRDVREKALHKVVESKAGEKCYIAEILPGGVYASDLSFMNIGQSGNPLNLILGQMRTGVSQNFITKAAEKKAEVDDGGAGQVSGFTPAEDMDTEEVGMVFAEFPDIETAYRYYQDKANYCSETDRIFSMCGKDYKYQVMSAVGDPIMTYENLQNIWLVFRIVAAVLAVIAVIVMVSTYGRLIGKDMKIIALYHAMGANKVQIKLVYLTYLLMLSLMTVGFAIVLGLGLAGLLSMVNMTALKQVFTLGFGMKVGEIWLVRWNSLLWCMIGLVLIAAVLAVVLGNGNFGAKKLAQKLK